MAKDYITYNEALNRRMNDMGFKRKNRETFRRQSGEKYGDAIQEISFSHSTYHIPHVRFYHVHAFLHYPKIDELNKTIGANIYSTGGNFGNIINGSFKEWRVAESDTPEYIEGVVVEEICTDMERYIIPFMNRYSFFENILEDVEKGILSNYLYDFFHMPAVLYYLLGSKQQAYAFLERKMEYLKQMTEENRPLYLSHYQEFIEKFKFYVDNHPIGEG
jgi:hypothetical protein